MGFDFNLPQESLKAALVMSLLSVWVLIGLFAYLNWHTRRAYFAIWTAGWLFYALWLTLAISLPHGTDRPLLQMIKQWCVGMAAVFLVWGGVRFLRLPSRQRIYALFMGFLLVWSYLAAYYLEDEWWPQVPVFSLVGLASGVVGWCFWRVRRRRVFLGAGLLAAGFTLWGAYLIGYPFLQQSEYSVCAGFFIATVLQLFIAVAMIVLVLEEARERHELAQKMLASRRTETKFLRQKVSATEERYRGLFEQAREGIVIAAGDDLSILECNPQARDLLGLARGEEGGQTLRSFLSARATAPGETPTPDQWIERVAEQGQMKLAPRTGGEIEVEVNAAPVDYAGRRAYQFFLRDVTARAALARQLGRAEKLSALGRMLAGVAHEINNPLAAIKGYAEVLLRREELNPRTRGDLERIARDGERVAALVRRLVAFAGLQPGHYAPADVNALVRRVLESRKADLAAAGAEVAADLAAGTPAAELDSEQISDVLGQLLTNSLQALEGVPPPRRITLRTRHTEGWVQLEIEDNGPGVPPEAAPHIFEPFFTTRKVGAGAGLGLSVAHSVVTGHGGRVYHRPSPTRGAAFVLELPLAQPRVAMTAPETAAALPLAPAPAEPEPELAPTPAAPATATPPTAPGAPAEILVLDDEPDVGEMLGEMLSLLGHTATVCQSGKTAIERLRERPFALVLSDFRMPEMDGAHFYRALLEVRPEMARRVVFLTGDAISPDARRFLQEVNLPYLLKPFRMAAIEKVLAAALQPTVSNPARDVLRRLGRRRDGRPPRAAQRGVP